MTNIDVHAQKQDGEQKKPRKSTTQADGMVSPKLEQMARLMINCSHWSPSS